MKDTISVYLAGNMVTDWRQNVVHQVRIVEEINKQKDFANNNIRFLMPRKSSNPVSNDYMIRDTLFVKKADVCFAYIEKHEQINRQFYYIGMSAEIGIAHALGKPIILANEYNTYDFEFINSLAMALFNGSNSLNNAIDCLNFMIDGWDK